MGGTRAQSLGIETLPMRVTNKSVQLNPTVLAAEPEQTVPSGWSVCLLSGPGTSAIMARFPAERAYVFSLR